ncbi:MAG: nucleoside 2-deoxyribosyltransferase domain-containing protein [Saprospiraceae bacterium]|nr:nucleoside 2-deoxyribosyltransferase domain-containing protein [Saprospiraceae bacterium]MCF8248382.1 nucleoside 2-deoxyribosyltransferase domain-containing protein [Saprospiraceae bacterium]MCF8280053.1 nucleoside 2-deoxyribosyltransferase domain-containing protein [Bacteroidales bacterium]MCF8309910.1 nucleoside 2-deoxyribosyltransferase domain-containing protein [Saprospiraceae bacterium]MCF8438759.1 nucleoside 2-deoxyribosyltransferase domain-containing protein [Saprospiraceae bacterium]
MQIFLGGTAGHSTWRKDIAIPILEAAEITYFNPQLGVGEWTPAHQQLEAHEKETSEVWLFVITGESRGVASLVEAAYRIGKGGKIALAIVDIPTETMFEGLPLGEQERKDLNRGRAYLREVATLNSVPVFDDVASATRYAVSLVK